MLRSRSQFRRDQSRAGGGRGFKNPRVSHRSPYPPLPLGKVLASIDHKDLKDLADEEAGPAQIINSQYLASYNWLDRASRTIMIPGEPPEFQKPDTPTKLREDSGTYYRDQNASRHPTYPLEPMIRAIQFENPDYQLQETDIVACGSSMGNLLRFARGSDKEFRILVEAVGDTVFFLRREISPFETIPGIYGYGHSFPEAYTTWTSEVRGSESHQRILEYEFAGMKALVRFEGDGFLPKLVPDYEDRPTKLPSSSFSTFSRSQSGSDTDSIPGMISAEEELLESMANTAVSATFPPRRTEHVEALKIEKGGRRIPQSAVFDLKTRSIKKKDVDTLAEELPRLWVAQIPNFMLAHHESGIFSSVQIIDATNNIETWQEENQETLVEFAALLRRLVAFARSLGKFEVVREVSSERLELREQGGKANGVLPVDLMEKWDGHI